MSFSTGSSPARGLMARKITLPTIRIPASSPSPVPLVLTPAIPSRQPQKNKPGPKPGVCHEGIWKVQGSKASSFPRFQETPKIAPGYGKLCDPRSPIPSSFADFYIKRGGVGGYPGKHSCAISG